MTAALFQPTASASVMVTVLVTVLTTVSTRWVWPSCRVKAPSVIGSNGAVPVVVNANTVGSRSGTVCLVMSTKPWRLTPATLPVPVLHLDFVPGVTVAGPVQTTPLPCQ